MNIRLAITNLLVATAVLVAGTGAAFAHSVASDTHAVRTAALSSTEGTESYGSSFASRFTAQSTSTAPVIEDVEATKIKEVSATIKWTTPNSSSTSIVMYGTESGNLDSEASDSQLVTEHAVPLSGLSPYTTYFYMVSSGNGVATTTDSTIREFTTEEAELMKRAFVGVVDDIDSSAGTVSLILNGNQGDITIHLPSDLEPKTPGGPRAGSFEVGASVVILAQKTEDGWVALRVLVKPVTPVPPIVGVVTEVIDGNVTVITKKGIAQTFELSEDADSPATGELVTAFGGAPGKGKGLVKAEKIRERLLKYLEDIINDDDDDNDDTETQIVQTLVGTIENHEAQETEVLDEVLTQAPEDVQETISNARGNSAKGRQQAQEAIARAKAKFNITQGSSNGRGKGNNGQGNEDDDPGPGNSPGNGQGAGPPGNSGGQGNQDDDSGPGNGPPDNAGQGTGPPGNSGGNSGGQGNQDDDSSPGNSGNKGRGNSVDKGGQGSGPGNSGNKGRGK